MWTVFKVFIEFVTIVLLFYVLVFWPRGMWDLSSLTRDWTCTPCIGRRSLNHWTAREVTRVSISFKFWCILQNCSLGKVYSSMPSQVVYKNIVIYCGLIFLLGYWAYGFKQWKHFYFWNNSNRLKCTDSNETRTHVCTRKITQVLTLCCTCLCYFKKNML